MKYQGGKGRIARPLVDAIESVVPPDVTTWIEPFVGGAWMLEEAFRRGRFTKLHAGDVLPDIILLYQAVAEGWTPPSVTTREMHTALKHAEPSALRALVGFGSCYGGTFFAGFCGDKINSGSPLTHAELAARHLERQRSVFAATDLRCCSYADWLPLAAPGVVVYCDPPYAGTFAYRGTTSFDSKAFWLWCQKCAEQGAHVFVSEYGGAPDFATEVWARTAKQTVARNKNAEVTEHLYYIAPQGDQVTEKADALTALNTAPPKPTLYDELWLKLDGAYARWRRYRRHGDQLPKGISLDHMEGRVIGLVQAVAIMSRGVMGEAEVKQECLRRWKDHQGLDKQRQSEDV